MSDAVTVPPGLLIRTTTALTLSSFEALVSSSLNVANMLGCGMRPSLSCALMTPDRSSNRIFPAPVPLSCTSCTGPDGSMRLTVMQPDCKLMTARKQSRTNVKGLNDARTKRGERRVSARRGWVGEKSDFFSLLLYMLFLH